MARAILLLPAGKLKPPVEVPEKQFLRMGMNTEGAWKLLGQQGRRDECRSLRFLLHQEDKLLKNLCLHLPGPFPGGSSGARPVPLLVTSASPPPLAPPPRSRGSKGGWSQSHGHSASRSCRARGVDRSCCRVGAGSREEVDGGGSDPAGGKQESVPVPRGRGRSGRVSGDGGDRGPGALGSPGVARGPAEYGGAGSLRHLSLRHPRLWRKVGKGPDPWELQRRAPGARFVGSVISWLYRGADNH